MDPFHNDPDFLLAFRRGELEALERVYRAFERPLRSFLLRGFAFKSSGRSFFCRGVLSKSDLEDVLQETFRRAFGERARKAYDGVRPYKNYLFTVARNAVINDLKAKSRQVLVGEALFPDRLDADRLELRDPRAEQPRGLETEPPSSEARLEHLEVYSMLIGLLETLPGEEQQFFRLRFLEQRSQEATARSLGWNRARVRKVEARLRALFLLQLKGSGYLERLGTSLDVRMSDAARRAARRSRSIWRDTSAERALELFEEAA